MQEKLKEGVQTKITPLVKKEAGKIKGIELNYVINALKYIKSNYKFLSNAKNIQKRTRTVDELIKSKTLTGCTDCAHLFLALCRAEKISSFYIETFDKDWIKKPSVNIKGRIFAKVKIKKGKLIVDPAHGSINFVGSYGNYEPMCEGFDFLALFPTREEYDKKIKKFLERKF